MFARPRSRTQDLELSVVAAIGIAAIGRGIAVLAEYLGASPATAHWLDDILTGVVAGAAIFVVMRGLANRRAAAIKRLQNIADMNHHIRNALEVIRSSHFTPKEEQRMELIANASERIVTALREFEVEQDIPRP